MYHYFGRILCCCILWRVAIPIQIQPYGHMCHGQNLGLLGHGHPATIRNSKIVVYIKPYENGGVTIPFL